VLQVKVSNGTVGLCLFQSVTLYLTVDCFAFHGFELATSDMIYDTLSHSLQRIR
jgi:hypothetical protein